MRVALTGTPGTGKTTVADRVETELRVVHLNAVIHEEDLVESVDEDRHSWVADLDAVAAWLDGRDDLLVESHLAHLVPVDRAIVLRCHPDELRERLTNRGEPSEKVQENAESEALDLILAEAVERLGEGNVYEIDTTGRSPDAVAADVAAAVRGDRDPAVGIVSFIDEFDAGDDVGGEAGR